MIIADALTWAIPVLAASETPKLDAEVLLAHCLQRDRTYLYTWPERALTDQQRSQFQQLVAQRQQGQPIAHIVGQREFWSLPLQVNSSTLIPRPDTEVLVEQALALETPENAQVLDLGTGTGAIALALKHSRPHWQVTAVDRMPAAVALATANAAALDLAVECLVSDWFSALEPQHQFAVIVSNPPYIAADDEHLLQGDVRFEPQSALVASEQGLADIKHIIATAGAFLEADGWLMLEHGWTQAAQVRELLRAHGFEAIHSVRDYANLERVTLGQWRVTHGQ